MFRLFITPTWFNGFDLLFNIVSLVIALSIAGYSWKIYRTHQENKFAYFSLAFLSLSAAYVFKVFTSGIVYFTPIRDVAANVLRPIAGQGLEFSGYLYRSGFTLHMIAILGAWLLIFFISQKSRSRLNKLHEVMQIGLFLYLIFLIAIVSNFTPVVFTLTSCVILSMIVLNYYKNYLNTNKNNNAFLVMMSFLLILFGNFMFVFTFFIRNLYVLGEVFVVLGFLLLLYTYRKTTGK
tara:strand:- start:31029 stop:31736 length:708 start_codon:yes stop_codon:yes gene_type:complete